MCPRFCNHYVSLLRNFIPHLRRLSFSSRGSCPLLPKRQTRREEEWDGEGKERASPHHPSTCIPFPENSFIVHFHCHGQGCIDWRGSSTRRDLEPGYWQPPLLLLPSTHLFLRLFFSLSLLFAILWASSLPPGDLGKRIVSNNCCKKRCRETISSQSLSLIIQMFLCLDL